jgi:hypothetical protein
VVKTDRNLSADLANYPDDLATGSSCPRFLRGKNRPGLTRGGPTITRRFRLVIANQMRSAIPKMSPHTAIVFSFEPERPITWRGYREEDALSSTKQKIECDIWMTG